MKILRHLTITALLSLTTFALSSCTVTHQVSTPPVDTAVRDIPIATSLPSSQFARQGLYHSVSPGETLWRISKMYDVDINEIKSANNITNVRDLDIGRKLYIPGASPRRHVISLYPSRKWKYIIIHHSATDYGSSKEFNAAHIKRGWKGIGYHFVIDNGTCGKDDGQIETSPRWIKQQDGAHCKADSMNTRGIGICLVGNFSEDSVSREQMDSLVYLVNTLRTFYNIPEKNIMGHGQVKGARTECPGTHFPWHTFRSKLASQ